MKNTMTAKRLRTILLIGMFATIILAVVGFVYAQKSLNDYAIAISKQNADAATGDQNIQTLRMLEKELSSRQSVIDQANTIVADNATYADRAISDISRIASSSGITLSSFEFVEDSAAAGATPSAAAAPATTPAPAPAATAAPAGVAKRSISVTLGSPLKYSSLMKFIEGIESNSLRMQISNVSMTKDKEDMVSTQPFTIGVYVQQ